MKKSTTILLIDIVLAAAIVSFVITTSLLGEYLILALTSIVLVDVMKSYLDARTYFKMS